MSLKNIYKSRLGASVFMTRMGKPLHFIDGKHITDSQEDIAELESEIKRNHPHIYVDPAESQVDTSLQDAIAEATREAALKVIAEFEAKKSAESQSQVSDQGGTVQAQAPAISAATLLGVAGSNKFADLSAPSGT